MKIINPQNLPQTLVNLAERDEYSRGNAHRSVTQLIDPPQISLLRREHDHEIEIDIADRLWALVGTTMHSMAEKGADEEHLAEERLFTEINGWNISGAIDVQHITEKGVTVLDYKFTSVWSVIYDLKKEWIAQQNCYAYLIEKEKGLTVNKLEIVTFLRDRNKQKAKQDSSYPQSDVVVLDVPLWSFEEREKYIEDRVKLHQEAFQQFSLEGTCLPCSDEERWKRADSFAVMKEGRKTAVRVLDSAEEAEKKLKSLGDKHFVEQRIGVPTRCADNYCNVSQWCQQYQQHLKTEEK